MLPNINRIKGVHPGAVLNRELKKRGLEKKQFALSLGEYPQTISAVSSGKRGISSALSIKLGKALGVDESYFMLLQAYYEIEREKKKELSQQNTPDLSIIRKSIFWDTDIQTIDWQKNKKAIIRRVFERGNENEIHEIISFYDKKIVSEALQTNPSRLPSMKINAKKYLNLKLDK